MVALLGPDDTAVAASMLRDGKLVAFPTETVYGLGASARLPAAVARVFAVKGRPAGHPLILHLADAAMLGEWAEATPVARTLAAAFWPGPLTLVLPRRAVVPDEVTGGRPTVGVRVPDHPVALAILRAFGGGVAAPSANRFGRVSPTTAAHVLADLGGDVDAVVDGGPAAVGVESTILEVTPDGLTILRPGGISAEQIEAVAGAAVERVAHGPARAPGMLAAHYSPRARVVVLDPDDGDAGRLGATVARLVASGESVAVLARAGLDDPPGAVVLEPPASTEDYARVLYARLREADERGASVIVCVAPAAVGVGIAVRDRLARAAATP